MGSVDNYIKQIIERGDEGSSFLARQTARTLNNNGYVDVVNAGMNGTSVLRLPYDRLVCVHSAGGDSREDDPRKYALSAVERLVEGARAIDAEPVAFANVIDSRDGNLDFLRAIADGLVEGANFYGLAIMNGENALLGDRVTSRPNVSLTMVSMLPEEDDLRSTRMFRQGNVTYAVFRHGHLAVFMNSDGVGTKTEFYERSGNYTRALHDVLAMQLDDLIKKGAIAKVASQVVETSGNIPFGDLELYAEGSWRGVEHILQREDVGSRIRSYKDGVPAYNISGSAVSLLDEKFLDRPLRPCAGDALVAVSGYPNPRSNGITAKRKIMVERFGEDWHITPEGKHFMEYLGAPSTVLYFAFRDLLDNNLATSFYHMSGGAYDGKLAKPLMAAGLSADIGNLFEPDKREIFFAEASGCSTRDAYRKFPMGNDGFFSSSDPAPAIERLSRMGLNGRVVGRLEQRDGAPSVSIRAYNGEVITFP